jgi:fructose-1,6-bisphosphatase/inositol monophosphatase family enzyme
MLPDRAFFDRLADAAKAETLPRFRSALSVTDKGGQFYDPVTEGDQRAETAIVTLIEATFPDHGILGEEHGSKGLDREFVWVIDPIDGTRAFISGVPVWGTLIGLYQNGRARMGVIDQPFTGERWFAAIIAGRVATRSSRQALARPFQALSSLPPRRISSKTRMIGATARSSARRNSSVMAAIAMPTHCSRAAMSTSWLKTRSSPMMSARSFPLSSRPAV